MNRATTFSSTKKFQAQVILFRSCSYIDPSNVASISNKLDVVIDPTQIKTNLVNSKKRGKKMS
jgi:hypothetical protein